MSVEQWSLAELRAAYASQAERRLHAIAVPQPTTAAPAASAVGVLGVSGGVGATTVALALAEALKVKHLLEFAPPHASGLAGAATDELGSGTGGVSACAASLSWPGASIPTTPRAAPPVRRSSTSGLGVARPSGMTSRVWLWWLVPLFPRSAGWRPACKSSMDPGWCR